MGKQKILFVGGGNMAQAIIGGLVENGYDAQSIYVVDHNAYKRESLLMKYKVQVAEKVDAVISTAEVIVLAVKPQGAKELCLALAGVLARSKPLVISIMAGVSLASMQVWLGAHLPIARTHAQHASISKRRSNCLFWQ